MQKFDLLLTKLSETRWGSDIGANPPVIDYEAVMQSDAGVAEWTSLIVSR